MYYLGLLFLKANGMTPRNSCYKVEGRQDHMEERQGDDTRR